ncbi:MAG: hypothetical protein HY925_04230, partial [Elusimicrobia bacterium]|nr:hypothetical protein [Elusimicrobiota bacterium]
MRQLAMAAAMAVLGTAQAMAADVNDVIKLSSHLKSLKFSGDLRIREDAESRKTVQKNDR